MRWVLGLTGGIASGKTQVANHFASLGAHLVDADVIARAIVSPGSDALQEIVKHFGQGIVVNGQLDRAQLRQQIFADSSDKNWLDTLLHPLIRVAITEELQQAQTASYTILVAPLLFENSLQYLTQRTLVVDAPEALQLARASQRDGSSPETINSIIAAQMPRAQRLALADDTLDNSGPWPQTQLAIAALHQRYLQFASAYDTLHPINSLPNL